MRRFVVIAAIFGVATLGALLVCVCSDNILWGWNSGNIEASKMVGDCLIDKINLFAKENGRLPRQLDEPVPRYLKSLTPPCAGEKRWHYSITGKGDTFYLGFSMPMDRPWCGYPSCDYQSAVGVWH